MGSLTKQIAKAVNKHLNTSKEAYENDALQTFDLTEKIQASIDEEYNVRRQARNKRKAIKRKTK